jgi:Tfp pilus assembly protein PilE
MFLTLVQIVIALVIVVVLLVIAFYIYNREYIQAIQTSTQTRKRVDIFKGIKDLKYNNNEIYETQDESNPTFKDIPVSVNQKGGAEFSYNFWLYKNNSLIQEGITADTLPTTTDAGLRTDDILLLLKGLNQPVVYTNLCGKEKTDVLVKCPMIKLQNGGKVLTVELNTNSGPDGVREDSRNTCTDVSRDWKSRNAHLLAVDGLGDPNYDKKWFMISVVVQDVTPYDPMPFRNRVRVAIYINGTLELDRYVDGRLNSVGDPASVVRQNTGPLYVAPNIKFKRYTGKDASGVPQYTSTEYTSGIPTGMREKALFMADLTYFNYVLPEEEIKSLYAAKFTKSIAPNITDTKIARDVIADMSDSFSYVSGDKQLTEF